MIVNMKILAIQVDTVWEAKAATHQRIEALLATAGPEPGTLIVLPEMCATGFSVNRAVVADDAETGATHRFLAAVAARYRCFVIAGVVVPIEGGRARNQAVVFNPEGDVVLRYDKMHPFTYGGEATLIDAGDRLIMFRIGEVVVCPLICYDLRFPELFRCAVRQGAQLFPLIANWPAARHDHWRTLSRARAIENQAWVVAVNRCGADPNHAYAGGSAIIDPRGIRVVEAGGDEAVLAADFALDDLLDYRSQFPVLDDMRDDFFPPG